MDDESISKVSKYLEFNEFKPDPRYGKDFIEIQAYCQWAGNEILNRMIEERARYMGPDSGFYQLSAEEVIKDFMEEMDYYRQISETDKQRKMFGVAVEEAQSIYSYIQS